MPSGDGSVSMTLEAGARLGRYRILDLLGRGGMADVYRAEDERLDREVALKLVPPEFARDPDRVERFEREVRAAAKLTHSNIVTVYEFGQGESQPFYTMALMRGGDLKTRIRSHPEGMPPEEARGIALAVARALAHAHGEGFVHRDVKPENILFGQDGVPQLTDFGIARAMSSGTRMTATGMSIGSPHYMSPEQARGQPVDGRSDLYSLGVVLYEMLTGKVPFDAADTFAVGLSHINDPVPKLPKKVAAWQPVLERLLAKSPADRYRNAGELVNGLASRGAPQPVVTQARPTGREVRPKMQDGGRERPLVQAMRAHQGILAALAGGALLALAVVGIVYLASRGSERQERSVSAAGGGGGPARSTANRPTPPRRVGPANPTRPFDFALPEPARPAPEDLSSDQSDSEARLAPPVSRRPARRSPPPPSPPERVPVLGGSALLVVETTPPGAEVLVDGERVGETPLERSDIGAGVREGTLRHPDYETVQVRALTPNGA